MITTTARIDGQKLRNILNYKGLARQDVSISIGKNKGYLSKCTLLNEMSKTSILLIEKMYGINPEDYEYVEPEPVKEETIEQPQGEVANSNADALNINQIEERLKKLEEVETNSNEILGRMLGALAQIYSLLK